MGRVLKIAKYGSNSEGKVGEPRERIRGTDKKKVQGKRRLGLDKRQ